MTATTRKAWTMFGLVATVVLLILAADLTTRRPHHIPAPPYADSLAGVVVRVTGKGDSADIAKVTWWQSPEGWLGLDWISTEPYRYRDSTLKGEAPIVAQADIARWRITFAKNQLTPFMAKHELLHLFARTGDHPAALFGPLESYTGR